jgi:hypothetical protein
MLFLGRILTSTQILFMVIILYVVTAIIRWYHRD